MDKIRIKNLEVFARHGVYPEENALGQKFLLSADLSLDLRAAGKTDALENSVDYGKACLLMRDYMGNRTVKLIETAAGGLAEELLLAFPLLRAADIELKKPWAPIGLPLETVSVEVGRGWHTAYLSMGSNMGDRQRYLDGAVRALDDVRGCRVKKVSNYIATAPYGVKDQPDFLNACLKLETFLSPEELLDIAHGIERQAGRKRTRRWGPRTLDIDIIFYDDIVLGTEDLCIPHADMHRREFVLGPLMELCPYMRHPVYGRTVEEMYRELVREG